MNPLAVSAEQGWRRALQGVAALAWLVPQMAALGSLAPIEDSLATDPPVPRHRLVVAGLGSIWHGFAVTRTPDFPTQRRVVRPVRLRGRGSPGGSGLVPVMVAAATAGPPAVGRLTFFSNVPPKWSGWAAIEDLCLSAGIEVAPWQPRPDTVGTDSVGRTSHIIFFDPKKSDGTAQLPRQRFIMDVQALTDANLTPKVQDWAGLQVPKAEVHAKFQASGDDDFLFTDQEADPEIIKDWCGPTVYETGASGDELVSRLVPIEARPTIWTAGVGPYLRTMVLLAERAPDETAFAGGMNGVLNHITKDPCIAAMAASDFQLRRGYADDHQFVTYNRCSPTYPDQNERIQWLHFQASCVRVVAIG